MKNQHLPFKFLFPFNRMLKSKFSFVLFLLVTVNHVQAQFTSVVKLNSVPSINAATGEKPQAKVWKYAGKYWAVFANDNGAYLWRLTNNTWNSVLKLTAKANCRADYRVVGSVTHILLYEGSSSEFVSVEYVSSSNSYQLWSKRSSIVSLTLDAGVETATIDIDGKQRMWLADAGTSQINVRYSDPPYSTWNGPITIYNGVMDDDICGNIYLKAQGKMAVLWSNQNTKRFGFKTHSDGEIPTAWSSDEVPASQSALDIGAGMADDHINLALSQNGTLYCAVKTGYDTKGYPKIALLVRRPAGTWDDLYNVSETGTRPIAILNELKNKIRIVYCSSENSGDILYRESSLSPISFGPPFVLIKGGLYNNPTSQHQNLTSQMVILASGSSTTTGVLVKDKSSFTSIRSLSLAGATSTPSAATTTGSIASVPLKGIVPKDQFILYPNPAISGAVVRFVLAQNSTYVISLYDIKGAQLSIIKQGSARSGELHIIQINRTELAEGTYLVKLQTNTLTKTLKLIVAR